ncbi:CapA family protein [Candidatus Saccharibacteria bacterium]|nr:CapA family protein [Candidatus Saccharibacteria bacterium]
MKKVFKILKWGFWIIICIAAVAMITCVILVSVYGVNRQEKTGEETINQAPPEPEVVSAETRLLFAGTTFWGRRTNTDARNSELGIKYPFSQLDTLDRKSYDAWIGGLECPVTQKENNYHNKYEEETIFKFNCDPDYLPEAAKYFDVFGLGNNHSGNQGAAGLAETRKRLAENGIQYYGTPKRSGTGESDPDFKNDDPNVTNCDIVVLPVRVKLDNDAEDKYQIPFGMCSAHGVYGVPGDDYIENMKTMAQYVPTIATPHMGAEYKTSSDTLRQNIYRRMIDYAGVEAVIADHTHWVQNAEAYNGKLITYSMGNFMFDQTFNAEVVRSAAIEAIVKIDIKDAKLDDWNAIGEECLADKATCYEKVKKAELPKLKLTWAYDYHATTSAGNRITRLGDAALQAAVGQRLNWGAIPAEMKIQK